MTGRLTDKVAFITGAARGQGRAHAVRMAREGADIIAVDIAGKLPSCVPYDSATPEDLAETARLVEATGRRIMASRPIFVTSTACVRPWTTASPRSGGSTSSSPTPASRRRRPGTRSLLNRFATCWTSTSPDVWNTVMAGAQQIIDGGRGGSIILISSAAGLKMQPFMVHYTASKHAVTGMARAFAAELGQHSIRVNSVHPGPVNTAMGSGDMVAAVPAPTRPFRRWRTCSHRSCRTG